MAPKRKHFRRDTNNGRFANAIRGKKRRAIRRLARDYSIPLTRIAKERGVSLETVLREKGGRLTNRMIQQLAFERVKNGLVKPIVEDIARAGQVVTIQSVLEIIRGMHPEWEPPSRGIVGKALQALESEGMRFRRPQEHEVALAAKRAREAGFRRIDRLIVDLRGANPRMRDSMLLAAINRRLPPGEKINYWLLRKRVTALKKAGSLPSARRGYKKP